MDEGVIEKLYERHPEYFQEHRIGKGRFITFRLPNPKVETEFRLGRAFMGILSAAGLAERIGHENAPLFEVILPMTETAKELIDIQDAFREIASLQHPLIRFTKNTIKHIEVIPLFESIQTIMRSDTILAEYVSMYKEKYGFTPPHTCVPMWQEAIRR